MHTLNNCLAHFKVQTVPFEKPKLLKIKIRPMLGAPHYNLKMAGTILGVVNGDGTKLYFYLGDTLPVYTWDWVPDQDMKKVLDQERDHVDTPR